jgi:hypothetical protein
MLSFLAGQDVAVPVALTRGGEPILPDDGAIQWELRGHDGAVLSPFSSLTGITDSVLTITVQASHNALGGDLLAKRTLTVRGVVGGVPFDVVVRYRLTDFLNMSTDADDVRKFIGCDDGELPDAEIDIVEAYFDILELLPTLAEALAATQGRERAANKAIAAQAVLTLVPSLPARLSKKATDGATAAERFEYDFDALADKARHARDKAITTARGTTSTTARTLISITQRADPLTGV